MCFGSCALDACCIAATPLTHTYTYTHAHTHTRTQWTRRSLPDMHWDATHTWVHHSPGCITGVHHRVHHRGASQGCITGVRHRGASQGCITVGASQGCITGCITVGASQGCITGVHHSPAPTVSTHHDAPNVVHPSICCDASMMTHPP